VHDCLSFERELASRIVPLAGGIKPGVGQRPCKRPPASGEVLQGREERFQGIRGQAGFPERAGRKKEKLL